MNLNLFDIIIIAKLDLISIFNCGYTFRITCLGLIKRNNEKMRKITRSISIPRIKSDPQSILY